MNFLTSLSDHLITEPRVQQAEIKVCPLSSQSLSARMEELEGFRVVVRALSKLGVKYMFGVVGIPVVEVAVAAQQEGSLRNIKLRKDSV